MARSRLQPFLLVYILDEMRTPSADIIEGLVIRQMHFLVPQRLEERLARNHEGLELPRSKLRGIESPACEQFPISSPPNVVIGAPVPNSPGFPLKTCGNDGLGNPNQCDAASRWESTRRD